MAVGKLLALLVLLQCSAALMGAGVRSSIIGGGDAPRGRWPGLVYLNIVTDSGKKKWHCSGSILNQKWILTAGRCWDEELRTRWDRTGVWIGTYELGMPSERYMNIDLVDRLPEFRAAGNGFINDIALLRLKYPLEFSNTVAPVNLPNEDETFDSSSECWIAGWGDIGKVALPKTKPVQEVQISILPQPDCKAKYPTMTDAMLCAGDPKGKKNPCDGDYGDPLMCRTARGFVQVGIMSYGNPNGCEVAGFPSIYTRVSSFIGYIKDRMRTLDEESASA
ncbi:tryptase-2-like [Poeciliopsis prolifica]|uniref:tryptase-2-like n=1 Tax=Poeciliopsis prolifica TaxID=188132 RepID=UPI002413B27C|nr:tryptase-2-like [Poeciliopsis prolifica]